MAHRGNLITKPPGVRAAPLLSRREKPALKAWITDLVADLVTDLVFIADAEGRLVKVNKAFEERMGYKQEELLGQTFDVVRFSEPGKAKAIQDYLRERDFISTIEMTYLTKTGEMVPVLVTMATLKDPRNNPVGLISVARDTSQIHDLINDLQSSNERLEEANRELKQAQAQLIRSERLAAIGQLAATISHELRNPLGVIRNVAYYLKMSVDGADERVGRQLEILERQVNSCTKIIADLLDFSRPKEPILERTNVNRAVEETLSHSEVPQNVTIEEELGENLPPISADGEQLQRVFFNILSNAIQAMPQGGRLRIRTARKDNFVEAEFTDSGGGIAEGNLNKIFEPLFSTKSKGTGLGLTISKTIVEEHRGTIEVESTLGQGATFTVRLPIS